MAAGVALVALLARAAYWGLATPDRILRSDASQYDFLAKNLAEGRGYVDVYPWLELHPTAFRPPGYPSLLGAVYWGLWPSPGIGRAVNVVLGVAVAATVVLLVDRHLGRRSAVAAGLGVALWPNLIANDTYVLTEPLSLLLLVAVLWCVLDQRWAAAGIATGLLVLTRPSAQYLVVVLAGWVLWRAGWRRAVVLVGVTALVVAPWVVRNQVEMGSPVLVTSNGFNYAALYSPPADEADRFVDPTQHPWFDDRRLDQADEVVWDRNLRDLAVDHVRDRPAVVPEVVWRNTRAYFELQPSLNDQAEALDGRHAGVRSWTSWLVWPLVVLGTWGLVRHRRTPLVLLSGIVAAYFTLASLVFVAPPRLRAPMELGLVIGAAALLSPRRVEGTPTTEPGREREPAGRGPSPSGTLG